MLLHDFLNVIGYSVAALSFILHNLYLLYGTCFGHRRLDLFWH